MTRSATDLRPAVPRAVRVAAIVAGMTFATAVGTTAPASARPTGPQHAEDHAHEHGGGAGERGPHDATARHRFDDVERWVERFDDPERDAWQRPDEVVRFLDAPDGAVVVDLGAGTGYFSVRLARALGEDTTVLAVDVEPGLVEHMRERAASLGLDNMQPRLAAHDDPDLPAGAVDRILVVDTWHHIDDRLRYLEHLGRSLKPGGSVVVVDFREGDLPVGPPPGHKIAEAHVRGEFEKAGWTLVRASDALPYQYMLEFRP